MKKNIPFTLPRGTPGIIMNAVPTDNGGIVLNIESASESFLAFLAHTGLESPVGKSLADTFREDAAAFHEWVEFVIRAQFMPYIKTPIYEDDKEISGQLLQYFSTVSMWLLVTLHCRKDSRYVMATFAKMRDKAERSAMGQLMGLKRQAALLENVTGVGHWTIDRASGRFFMSRKMAQMLRFGDDAMIAPLRHMLDTVHSEDIEGVLSALDCAGGAGTFYSRSTLGDGSVVFLRSHLSPVRDDDGSLARIIGCSEDITEHMLSKERLLASERRFRKIVENTDGLMVVTDPAGLIQYVSPHTALILEKTPEQLVGRLYTALFSKVDDKLRVMDKIGGIIERGSAGRLELRISMPGGGYRWYAFNVFTVPDERGGNAETVGIGHDISHIKLKESKLLHLSTHDGLTGVYNRSYFWNALDELQKDSRAHFHIVVADVNGLKMINDVFGHRKGDIALKEIAGVIKRSFGRRRVISRIGGGEFGIIAYGYSEDELDRACAAVNDWCAGTRRRLLPISVSFGRAARGESSLSVHEVMELAENRLFSSKLLAAESARSHLIGSLRETLCLHSNETAEHMARMQDMAAALSRRMRLPPGEHDRLLLLAALHDVGKVAIPASIINKPSALTDDEREIMRGHCEMGYRIAMASQDLACIAQEILSHHERWDGGGYPLGRAGDEIPLLAQIISVVDAYDAMTHKRAYNSPLSHSEAVAELWRCSGSQFSPVIVSLFGKTFGGQPQPSLPAKAVPPAAS